MTERKVVSCKIGTIPAVVYIVGFAKPEVGKWLYVQYKGHGEKPFKVLVDKVNPDGYFFASK